LYQDNSEAFLSRDCISKEEFELCEGMIKIRLYKNVSLSLFRGRMLGVVFDIGYYSGSV
jgi:hypothetical protein